MYDLIVMLSSCTQGLQGLGVDVYFSAIEYFGQQIMLTWVT
jgi:hypothetical protein